MPYASERPLKEKVSLSLDAPLLEKLRQYADEEDRSLSQYINLALKKHVEARQKPAAD